jgi:hypothetical protein
MGTQRRLFVISTIGDGARRIFADKIFANIILQATQRVEHLHGIEIVPRRDDHNRDQSWMQGLRGRRRRQFLLCPS